MREEDERYFERLESRLDEALERAEAARSRGADPEPTVEIPAARDMADRVENILGIDGVADRVRELEGTFSREEAALELAKDFANGTVGDYETKAGKVEGAVRTAVALLTEGVVAAPIEGIDRVEILPNDDGTEFVNVYYAGPIRSAGGTAQALSVLVADYTRALVGLEEFEARSDEIERYAEEVALYDSETGLQYSPSDEETKFIASNLPIMLDGEATGDEEVSGYRDLDRVDTNSARGGMCLVLAEGIALKAPKIQRYTSQLDEVDWPWLQDLIDGTYGASSASVPGDNPDGTKAEDDAEDTESANDAADVRDRGAEVGSNSAEPAVEDVEAGAEAEGEPPVPEDGSVEESAGNGSEADGNDTTTDNHPESTHDTHSEPTYDAEVDHDNDAEEDHDSDSVPDGPVRPDPSKKFLRDLIAGRPVFSHPSANGGFRLRYGRARNHGFATGGVHPATMHLVDDFLATGTQIKTERPGKAHGVVPVDSIEGPTVRLANGDVRRIDDPEEALSVRNGVEAVLDLGEYLVNYGEFVENNHPLAPASYVYEWWIQDLEAAGADVQALLDDPRIDPEHPTAAEALEWAREYDAPLHPTYTYLWHDLSVAAFCTLAEAVSNGRLDGDGPVHARTLVVEHTDAVRDALETIVIEHRQRDDRIEIDDWMPFVLTLGCEVTEADEDAGAAVGDSGSASVGESEDADDGNRSESENRNESDGNSTTGSPFQITRPWTASDLSKRARTWGGTETDAPETDGPDDHSEADGASADAGADGDGDVDVDSPGTNAIEAVNEVAPFTVRERAPTRIGNRMGRPEKSERRDLSPSVHTLFPIGDAGGDQRDVAKAGKHAETMSDTPGVVEVDVARKRCSDCGEGTYENRCPRCDARTTLEYRCPDCDRVVEPDGAGRAECSRCDRSATCVERQEIDVHEAYRNALDTVGERENSFEILKGVKGLTSAAKIPEPIEKGVLRAKHDVSSFKDGTVRYDMTDLPVTAVRASELDVTAGQLRALGYETDVYGEPLTHDDQLIELKVQDVVLSDGAAEHMLRTANFIDDLLTQYYDLPPFYQVEDREDLVGELVFGMAPHTSAAVIGRVIGFTSAAVGYAHPFFHAAKRRNCFHPETTIEYVDEDAGRVRDVTIERFVEQRLTDPETDAAGTQYQHLADPVFVPSVTSDGRIVTRPVETVSKRPAPAHLVRIETRDGRSLTVTPDHTMLVRDSEAAAVERKRASTLEPGDGLPAPPNDGGSMGAGGRLERRRQASDEKLTDSAATEKLSANATATPDGGIAVEPTPGGGIAVEPTPGGGIAIEPTPGGGTAVEPTPDEGTAVEATPGGETAVEPTPGGGTAVESDATEGESVEYRPVGDEVTAVEIVPSDAASVYCLTVSDTHSLVANDLFTGQCDGDEDCVMLLLDGLINFSKSYLPSSRGGRMDAPLVMSSRIDPSEIDDEAHNVDIVSEYPREFYHASLEMADPDSVDVEIAEDTLGTDEEYTGFEHTHDTTNIAMGPNLSAYKTLGSMMDKMDAQLELARKLRAVDETDVAERVIEYHFLPDLIGNLRAFSRQETRCLDCGVKFRRMPLTEVCRECGGNVSLTVHQGSVNKYMQTAMEVAEEYDCRDYTKQRLEVLQWSLESIFENDKNKPTTIADFMGGPGTDSSADTRSDGGSSTSSQ